MKPGVETARKLNRHFALVIIQEWKRRLCRPYPHSQHPFLLPPRSHPRCPLHSHSPTEFDNSCLAGRVRPKWSPKHVMNWGWEASVSRDTVSLSSPCPLASLPCFRPLSAGLAGLQSHWHQQLLDRPKHSPIFRLLNLVFPPFCTLFP